MCLVLCFVHKFNFNFNLPLCFGRFSSIIIINNKVFMHELCISYKKFYQTFDLNNINWNIEMIRKFHFFVEKDFNFILNERFLKIF